MDNFVELPTKKLMVGLDRRTRFVYALGELGKAAKKPREPMVSVVLFDDGSKTVDLLAKQFKIRRIAGCQLIKLESEKK